MNSMAGRDRMRRDGLEIVKIVDEAIDQLREEFAVNPTFFFTERDITCRLYSRILSNAQDSTLEAMDKSGHRHLLLHTEYSTPFRCFMKKKAFRVVGNNDEGGRGKYDLVVLNPEFIEQNTYPVIYGQSFKNCTTNIVPWCERNGPFILYGLELMLKRKPLGRKKNQNRWATWDGKIKSIVQDMEKLNAARQLGFIYKTKAMLFVREYTREIEEHLSISVPRDESLLVCFGERISSIGQKTKGV